ncbi:ribosome maturation factor RimM,putative [Plasmodium sp. DRC-Itaito]|nr:ribosome maturation factor RimM,putative [Plasmodium sp. DRC-Itaito]
MIVLSTYKKCLVLLYYFVLFWVLKYYKLSCKYNNFKNNIYFLKERRNNIIYLFNNYKKEIFIYHYSNRKGKPRSIPLFVHPRNCFIYKKNENQTLNAPFLTRRGIYINNNNRTKKNIFSLLFVFFSRIKYHGGGEKKKKLYYNNVAKRNIRLNEKKDKTYDNNNQCDHNIKKNNNMKENLEKGESEHDTQIDNTDEEINQSERKFLTDTKYYKRSKYSKAGYIKEKHNNNNNNSNIMEKHQEETKKKKKEKKGVDLFDDFLNDRYNIYYTENKEDLFEKKKKNEKKMSLPDFFILNYYLDKNRKNNLDLINDINHNNNIIKVGSDSTSSFSNMIKNTLQKNVSEEKVDCNNGNINNDSNKNRNDNNSSDSSDSSSDYNNYQSYSKHTEFINNYSVIGQIIGVHGLLGWLKIISFTTFNDIRFEPGCYRYIFMNNYNYPLPIKILEVKESQKISFLYIKIEGINTRGDALKLKNCLICDDKRTFPDIGENQYISTDLLNFDIYIFNDFSHTSIGNVNGFLSKYDYINSKSVQEISDDLIKIHLKKNISLEKVFNIINVAKLYNQKNNSTNLQDSQYNSPIKNIQSIKVLINKSDTNNAYEENIDDTNIPSEPIKNDKNYYDSLDNFDGYTYKKIFKCDYCDHIFDDIKQASIHENSHFSSDEELLYNHTNIDASDKQKVYEVTKDQAKKLKNIQYFLVPIVKEKTIRSVHYEDKKIYLDISTIFLLDDNK